MVSAHALQMQIEADFADLWPSVKAGLSVAATLLLEDNANPTALALVGASGATKTAVLQMFEGHEWTYSTDTFTPAAFVSPAANVPTERLAKVDLLPRIRHKVLLTPELAPLFRGKEDELTERFRILTRVLDGQGLWSDKGVHGGRGYRGDYLFAWFGATTPLDERVFRIMAQLGTRLFFFEVPPQAVSTETLAGAVEGDSYLLRLERCRQAVHGFLSALKATAGGVRGVKWEPGGDVDRAVRESIARWARALAAMRSEPAKEPDPQRGGDYTPAREESPWRAFAVLYNLARGHALVYGRRCLTADDLPLVAHVGVSSMPSAGARVFRALVEQGGAALTVTVVQGVLGAQHPETARRVMADLERRGVMEFVEDGPGKAAVLVFREGWAWFGSEQARDMLAGALVTSEGVCATEEEAVSEEGPCVGSPTQPVTHEGVCVVSGVGEGGGEEGEGAHGAPGMTGPPVGDLAGAPGGPPLPAPEVHVCAVCSRPVPKGQLLEHCKRHLAEEGW